MGAYLGDFPVDHTGVIIPLNAFTSDDPSASATITEFANTDVHIHKNGGLTQRTSASGVAVVIDFDGITGNHVVTIDLSDNTDAGFYVAGSEITVRIEGTVIDGATINAWIASFSIERAGGTIALLKLIQTAVITNAAGADIAADIIAVKAETVEIVTDTGTTLDTLIKDVPTVAEFEARSDLVGTAATPAEVATALDTYDAPTKAEMDTAHALLATVAKQDVIDGIVDNILADTGELQTDDIPAVLTAMKGATFDTATDSLEALRNRGDAAWTTGGGGAISEILSVQPLIPNAIDLANTVTFRIGLGLTNMLDDLPSTAEITPGTITIDRKAIGGTSWTNIVNAAACSELAGLVYYDEVFDSGTGYAAGDTIRITFKSQKITVDANDFEITGTDGWVFHTFIREAMRGTDSAALAATALSDAVWTNAKAAFLDHSIATVDTVADGIQTDLSNVTDGLGALKALIDALNDLSAANVETACDASLASYDSPTKAEMDTGHGLLATEAKQDIIDTVVDAIKAVTDVLPNAGALSDLATILIDTNELQTDDIPSLIAALNDLSAAQAEAACDASLVTYDAPTKAEMDTAHALLATPAQVNTEMDSALNTAIPGTPTGDSINDYIQRLKWGLINKLVITEATGNAVGYKDDDVTPAFTVAVAFDSDGTDTTRKRLE